VHEKGKRFYYAMLYQGFWCFRGTPKECYMILGTAVGRKRCITEHKQEVEGKRNVMAHGVAQEGEVKGKDANGVGSQQLCTVRRNMVYPALLPTTKTCDNLASSIVSRELRSNKRQFQHHCFHITLNCC